MSKYTTEVRFICENAAGLIESLGEGSIEDIITKAAPKVFNFDFPIFDESYRITLEKQILRAYYTREIGEETVGLWKLRLNSRLNLIMPKYNQLYESARLQFNPLYDVDYKRFGTNSGQGQSSGSSQAQNMYSDTPQNGLSSVLSGEYLTNAEVSDNNSNSQSSNSGQFEETIQGKTAGSSYSRLLKEYRQTFLNIDNMVVSELNDLFMGLW